MYIILFDYNPQIVFRLTHFVCFYFRTIQPSSRDVFSKMAKKKNGCGCHTSSERFSIYNFLFCIFFFLRCSLSVGDPVLLLRVRPSASGPACGSRRTDRRRGQTLQRRTAAVGRAPSRAVRGQKRRGGSAYRGIAFAARAPGAPVYFERNPVRRIRFCGRPVLRSTPDDDLKIHRPSAKKSD